MKYRKRPIVIEASQWWQNGDHPLDYSKAHEGLEDGCLRQLPPDERKANSWEGDVVRYFRHPDKAARLANALAGGDGVGDGGEQAPAFGEIRLDGHSMFLCLDGQRRLIRPAPLC